MAEKIYDLVGIGLGPANLSTAALLHKCPDVEVLFLEQKEKFSWHANMMFAFSSINVGFYKDLVTLVDPTNPYSFMNYLVVNNKHYSFFNSAFNRVSRTEFEKYFQWVAQKIPYILFSCHVDLIEYQEERNLFKVTSNQGIFLTKNVLIGTGIATKLPKGIHCDGKSVFHGYDALMHEKNFTGEKVLIVGGGQSSAEIIYALLESDHQLPSHIYWVTTKGYPVILDENPFANEIYTPAFAHFFYNLEENKKGGFCKILRDTSDGIQGALLTHIYQRLFFLNKTRHLPVKLTFFPLCKLQTLTQSSPPNNRKTYDAIIKGLIDQTIPELDKVIFCTGFTHKSPKFLEKLKNFYGNTMIIEKDFSVRSLRGEKNKIFINNGAKEFFGPADPNLSLISWRSAAIINSLVKKEIYPLSHTEEMMSWGT